MLYQLSYEALLEAGQWVSRYKLNSLLTCIALVEVMGSNPVEASEFFSGLSLQLL